MPVDTQSFSHSRAGLPPPTGSHPSSWVLGEKEAGTQLTGQATIPSLEPGFGERALVCCRQGPPHGTHEAPKTTVTEEVFLVRLQ